MSFFAVSVGLIRYRHGTPQAALFSIRKALSFCASHTLAKVGAAKGCGAGTPSGSKRPQGTAFAYPIANPVMSAPAPIPCSIL